MGQHDKYLVKYALGKPKNLAKAWNKTRPWKDFYTDLSTPTKTGELRAAFDEMSKDEQDVLKAVGGWISTAQCENNNRSLKNILPRNLMSLDLDYCSIELKDAIEAGTSPLSRFESFTHSSRRHTERKPRLRIFLPLSREVDADEYHALVRIVSYVLDGKREPIIQVDRVSARPAQMMFKPTISKDGDWFCHLQEGKLLDPDYFFKLWRNKKGDPFDLSKLPLFDTETAIRRSAEKSENPLTKPGIIGAFNRAHSVEDAMEKFLPGVYIPGDAHSGQPRYTYAGSTSSNGAIVYDDGLFLYSNHGHDPCCEMNVNAFDMVRMHLYGELDEGVDQHNTSVNKLPSFKAMMEFAQNDKGAKHELMKERYALVGQFEDESDEPEENADADESVTPDYDDLIGDGPPKKTKKKKKGDAWSWMDRLECDRNGKIDPSIANYSLILQNDKRLVGAICDNMFTGQLTLRKTLEAKLDTAPIVVCEDPLRGQTFADKDDSVIRAIMDAPTDLGGYGIRPSNIANLRDAIVNTSGLQKFHPVKEYLESLRWDGKRRIDTFFIRFLKLQDTPYTREVSRLTLVASVTRIYEPGHKFDYMPVLGGPQGIGKSTFIKELYGDHWFGEVDCKLDDKREVTELLPGMWGMEAPEMDSFRKADSTANKKFLRKQEYTVRAAYAHRAMVMRVQTVFWGSTNETRYLRDPSGNRSYWPLQCGFSSGENIDTDGVRGERDQLWAEAYAAYLEMRREWPKSVLPTLPLTLSKKAIPEAVQKQEGARAKEIHEELADRMLEQADEPIRLSDLLREYGNASQRFDEESETDPDTVWVLRCALLRKDLIRFAYGDKIDVLTDQMKKSNFDRAEDLFLKVWKAPSMTPRKKFGGLASGRWYVREACDEKDKVLGYKIIRIENDPDDLLG
ncbi:MAG: virulence-associated E family protein [Alphaproteobacteria bacterium]|nr:virulence-associated E family protein [Alphaproteobacteria bacterium]